MAQQNNLFSQPDTSAPLDQSDKYLEIIKIEKSLVASLRNAEDRGASSILPKELIEIERIEEEEEDEEIEEEEEEVEDEEEAGGDYLVTHFDNGEGYEEIDEDDAGEII